MKITKNVWPGATLPEDKEGPLSLDFSNTLIFSRNQHGLFIGNSVKDIALKNAQVWTARGKGGRIRLFLRWSWQLWKFTEGHKKDFNS